MHFEPTSFDCAWQVLVDPFRDERGSFERTFCAREFGDRGLCTRFVQHSVSKTKEAGTLRGMHFQTAPYAETKLVRCSKGRIFDVIIDLRSGSATRGRWQGFELSGESGAQLYIPQGFAHGFQALCDDIEVTYLISEFYTPEAASGVRYDDPAFGIHWPLAVTHISERDRSWTTFPSSV